MNITTGNIKVQVELPVQFRAAKNGGSVTVFDIRVFGLPSLYNELGDEIKALIASRAAEAAASCSESNDDWK